MRIAIIGTGIAGNVAAYKLRQEHEITVFEAGSYVGGHTNTVDVYENGQHFAVDTGFIVFNNRTYPNFIALLDEMRIPQFVVEGLSHDLFFLLSYCGGCRKRRGV